MKRTYLPLIIFTLTAFIFYSCNGGGDEPDPGPNPTTVGKASNVFLDDVSNNGNSSDLTVSFNIPSDESNISEYRVILVTSDDVNGLTITQALALNANAYTRVDKTGSDINTNLSASMVDTNGEAFQNGSNYVAFVLSIAETGDTTVSAISLSSNDIETGITSIKVTYAGNMGGSDNGWHQSSGY